jgi:hypothetical protein
VISSRFEFYWFNYSYLHHNFIVCEIFHEISRSKGFGNTAVRAKPAGSDIRIVVKGEPAIPVPIVFEILLLSVDYFQREAIIGHNPEGVEVLSFYTSSFKLGREIHGAVIR